MIAAVIGIALGAAADTTVLIGRAERDLTGDGKPEVLQLVGVGRTIDSLDVTLTITSGGRTIFRSGFAPLTRRISPGGDAIVAIAWSARDQRFYRIMECC